MPATAASAPYHHPLIRLPRPHVEPDDSAPRVIAAVRARIEHLLGLCTGIVHDQRSTHPAPVMTVGLSTEEAARHAAALLDGVDGEDALLTDVTLVEATHGWDVVGTVAEAWR